MICVCPEYGGFGWQLVLGTDMLSDGLGRISVNSIRFRSFTFYSKNHNGSSDFVDIRWWLSNVLRLKYSATTSGAPGITQRTNATAQRRAITMCEPFLHVDAA